MRRRGFTLIEVLVVLSLLGVLFGLSIGFVARAGKGNLLQQTANSLVSQIATTRAQSHGNDSAYVKVETRADGDAIIRSFRNRQVFHWACEDFTRASSDNALHQSGPVDIATAGLSSGEGRHVQFGGGRVELENLPDLAFRDGFQIRCRINPAADGSSNVDLFKKGTHYSITLRHVGGGRYDLEAKIKLQQDVEGEGGGDYTVKTGFREVKEVVEWQAPVVGGRWQDLTVSYDRNTFVIYVNGRLRAIRSDRRNAMVPETVSRLVIGAGYVGGFDSLLISGIFEDTDDVYRVPPQVVWIDEQGNAVTRALDIHFKNRGLDPQHHSKPIELIFKLNDEKGARRIVQVTMSGETLIKEPGE